MNILFCSVPFRPSVGGIETVSSILVEQFHNLGHKVTLVTQTPATEPEAEPYAVVRRPGAWRLWQLMRAADVVFHNNISLRLAWPLLALRRPWVVAHHTWIPHHGVGRIKRWLLRFARNISVSQAVADDLPIRSTVLQNPYRASLFRPMEGVQRHRDVVFVGRLVSDKGVDVLLDALHRLQLRGITLTSTLVGDGPQEGALRLLAQRLGLSSVDFAGRQSGAALVRLLHEHRLLVVPSIWEEPFGVVVLEALACGCVPVVAHSGGLRDAAGPCGHVVTKGDAQALADELAALHADPQRCEGLLEPAPEHLSRHLPEHVAAGYLRVMTDACLGNRRAVAA